MGFCVWNHAARTVGTLDGQRQESDRGEEMGGQSRFNQVIQLPIHMKFGEFTKTTNPAVIDGDLGDRSGMVADFEHFFQGIPVLINPDFFVRNVPLG